MTVRWDVVRYRDVARLEGPLLVVRGLHGVGWDEFATVHVEGEESRHGLVLDVDADTAIVEVLEGTQGIGVILAPEAKVAEAIIETLHSTNQNVLIQKFVAESRGRDIRALVVGDRVVAGMRRVAQGDDRAGLVAERVGIPLDRGREVIARDALEAEDGAAGTDEGEAMLEPLGEIERRARGGGVVVADVVGVEADGEGVQVG